MRILLVDSRAQVRTMLRRVMRHEPELSVVGEATDAQDLVAQAQAVHPDLLLLDWELPGLQGGDLLSTLHCLASPIKVVAYSKRTGARREALTGGADAFVSRDEPLEWLLIALQKVGGLSPYFAG